MLKSNKIICAFMYGAMLAACATPYTDAVSYMQFSDRVYQIRSAGNSSTGKNRIENYALLAAAELCVNQGFSHFSRMTVETDRNDAMLYLPPTSQTTCNNYGGSVMCHTNYSGYGGGPIILTTYDTKIEIYMHKAEENVPVTAYQCSTMINNLATLKEQ